MSYEKKVEQELTGDLMRALVALGYEAYKHYDDPLRPYDLTDVEQLAAVLDDYRQQWGRTDPSFILETAQRYLQDESAKAHLWVLARDVGERQGLVQGVAAVVGSRMLQARGEDIDESATGLELLRSHPLTFGGDQNIQEEGVVQSVLLAPYMGDELKGYHGSEDLLGEKLATMRGTELDVGETPGWWRPYLRSQVTVPSRPIFEVAQLFGPLTVGAEDMHVYTEIRSAFGREKSWDDFEPELNPRRSSLKKKLMR